MPQSDLNSARATPINRRSQNAVAKAFGEATRRIEAFARTTNDPAARQAYANSIMVLTEVRDQEKVA